MTSRGVVKEEAVNRLRNVKVSREGQIKSICKSIDELRLDERKRLEIVKRILETKRIVLINRTERTFRKLERKYIKKQEEIARTRLVKHKQEDELGRQVGR